MKVGEKKIKLTGLRVLKKFILTTLRKLLRTKTVYPNRLSLCTLCLNKRLRTYLQYSLPWQEAWFKTWEFSSQIRSCTLHPSWIYFFWGFSAWNFFILTGSGRVQRICSRNIYSQNPQSGRFIKYWPQLMQAPNIYYRAWKVFSLQRDFTWK